jgi:hypothetical protein
LISRRNDKGDLLSLIEKATDANLFTAVRVIYVRNDFRTRSAKGYGAS